MFVFLLMSLTSKIDVQNPKWFDIEHPTTNRGCFGCHNYNPDKKNALHLSHMFILQDNSREIVDLTVSLFFQQVNIVSLFVSQLRIFFPISLLFLVRLKSG
jgi:hypothetical protein